jgi:hypothetical protein
MRTQLELVVAPSAPPPGTSRLTYVRASVGSPVCLAVAMFAGCLGFGSAGLLGATIAVMIVVMIAANMARSRRVRAYVDEQNRLRARAKHEAERMKLLRPTGTTRIQHYNEVRVLVDEIERIDPSQAARFELQDLLDHFVHLAVKHQRCNESLRLAGADTLPAATPIAHASKSKRRRDILQRRIRHREQCVQMMEKLVDEMEGIADLVRLIAQRTACPTLDVELDREIDRRLWELDELEAALHQLSA